MSNTRLKELYEEMLLLRRFDQLSMRLKMKDLIYSGYHPTRDRRQWPLDSVVHSAMMTYYSPHTARTAMPWLADAQWRLS